MLELASLGAGVMHSRSIEFAKKYRVPVLVRPSYSDGEGTLIAPETENESSVATGVALARNEARVSLLDIPDRPGVMSTIFTKMAQRRIPVDMIAQNIGAGGLAQVSFTVQQDELAETLTAAQEAVQQLGAGTVQHGTNLSKVSVVGSGMKTHTGVAAQMFRALAMAGVNVEMITTGDIKISVLVDRNQAEGALIGAHQAFRLDRAQPEPPSLGFAQPPEDEADEIGRGELERDIVARLANMEDIVVSEVQLDRDQARVTLRNLPDVPGVLAQVFGANAQAGVMVDIIVQDVSQSGHAHLSFTVPRDDLERSLLITRDVVSQWSGVEVSYEREIASLSVMGIGLRTHTGVGEKMFHALGEQGINVELITTSEVRICIVVALDVAERAQQSLLETFSLVRP
jgi:aspartate kinase